MCSGGPLKCKTRLRSRTSSKCLRTSKARKTIVFHCQICKFVTILLPYYYVRLIFWFWFFFVCFFFSKIESSKNQGRIKQWHSFLYIDCLHVHKKEKTSIVAFTRAVCQASTLSETKNDTNFAEKHNCVEAVRDYYTRQIDLCVVQVVPR